MHAWPLFGISVTTPRLQLRLPRDHELEQLASVARGGIHDADYMPFKQPWSLLASPDFERSFMQFHWGRRADWRADHWTLPLAAFAGGEVIGSQGVAANDFRLLRSVETGSWLGRPWQGQGLGKEMRAAVLHLAFEGLGAEVAYTGAYFDNAASLGVTRSLGYEPNGEDRIARQGRAVRHLRFRLTRERWLEHRREDITLTGLDECRDLFGAIA